MFMNIDLFRRVDFLIIGGEAGCILCCLLFHICIHIYLHQHKHQHKHQTLPRVTHARMHFNRVRSSSSASTSTHTSTQILVDNNNAMYSPPSPFPSPTTVPTTALSPNLLHTVLYFIPAVSMYDR